MKLTGRVINKGTLTAQAVVLDVAFSLIGDFDPATGTLAIEGHPLAGESLANKILVCPTGKGGTIAPFIAYEAWQRGNAPAGILCQTADPLLCESAITIQIPILDCFDQDPVAVIKTGDTVSIRGGEVTVDKRG